MDAYTQCLADLKSGFGVDADLLSPQQIARLSGNPLKSVHVVPTIHGQACNVSFEIAVSLSPSIP